MSPRWLLILGFLFVGSCKSDPCDPPCTGGWVCDTSTGDIGMCVESICGNGKVEADETCDDGNKIEYDTCPNTCSGVCTCENGTEATGSECTAHNSEICVGCNDGFNLGDATCTAVPCTCANGKEATGNNCTKPGEKICTSCDPGFHLDGNNCSANTCTCTGGTKATGIKCTKHNTNICTSCNTGYESGANNTCTDIDECTGITCGNGGNCTEADGETTPGNYTCGSCNPGYEGGLKKTCTDIDECAAVTCGHGGKCTQRTLGNYTCENCNKGYDGGLNKTCTEITPPAGMALIPGGDFIYGCSNFYDNILGPGLVDCPQGYYVAKTAPYFMDKYEVTAAEYKECVEAGNCTYGTTGVTEANHTATNGDASYSDVHTYENNKANHPINYVNYHDALNYCTWKRKRLPSNKEWEKAAAGTDGGDFSWGDTAASCSLAAIKDGGPGCGTNGTLPVGSKPAGKSPYDVYDMNGNVDEWVAEWHPISGGGTFRVKRGGTLNDTPTNSNLKTSVQYFGGPNVRRDYRFLYQ